MEKGNHARGWEWLIKHHINLSIRYINMNITGWLIKL